MTHNFLFSPFKSGKKGKINQVYDWTVDHDSRYILWSNLLIILFYVKMDFNEFKKLNKNQQTKLLWQKYKNRDIKNIK